MLKSKSSADGPLRSWLLAHGYSSYDNFSNMNIANGKYRFSYGSKERWAEIDAEKNYNQIDQLSQINCLEQISNISSYDFVKELVDEGKVRLHAMWFDIYSGEVLYFRRDEGRFVSIGEENYLDCIRDGERVE